MTITKNPFVSDGTYWINCPHPDCGHSGDILTKMHCKLAHGMTREELVKKYGKPTTTSKAIKKEDFTDATTYYFF